MSDNVALALTVLYCTMLVSAGYYLIAPFLPAQLALRSINSLFNASIFGVFNLSAIFVSFTGPGLVLSRCSKLSTLAAGALIQASSLVAMGLASFMPGVPLFLALIHGCRLAQGVGEGLTYLVQYSILASLYPHKTALLSTLISVAESIGNLLGPGLGAILYQHLGYLGPFLVLGGAALFPGLLLVLLFLRKSSE